MKTCLTRADVTLLCEALDAFEEAKEDAEESDPPGRGGYSPGRSKPRRGR